MRVQPVSPISVPEYHSAPQPKLSLVEEPETGILFQPTLDQKKLLGFGVRKKFAIVNVYAVGFYGDPHDFDSLADETEYEEALLNPHNHRTIRIVMNRGLSIDKYTAAIVESLEPRMKGKDLDK